MRNRIAHLHRATLLPAGCDGQGRYETRAPCPAEASTEIGADYPATEHDARNAVLAVLAPWMVSVLSFALLAAA